MYFRQMAGSLHLTTGKKTMFFSIIILILVLLVAFIHFVQGFFSAALSAILAVFSAAIAVGFHESVVAWMRPGKLADSANAVVLCSLFAGSYVLLRLLFDRTVPGNVRLQSTVDKIGAAVMGLVAGTVAAGVLAIAAQTMSFGASVFGYSRYAVSGRDEFSLQPDRNKNSISRFIYDQMKSDKFEEKDVNHLLLPADDFVLGLVGMLSEGSLSGTSPLAAVHQDYLQEAFGTRVGIEVGARRTATNLGPGTQVTVDGIYLRERLKAVMDSELPEIRGGKDNTPVDPNATLPKDEVKLAKLDLKPADKQQQILIIRTFFDRNATDEKNDLVRFTPASVRLVGHDANGKARDYHPIGTMDTFGGGTFWPSRIDDAIFVRVTDKSGADLVFMIDNREDVLEGAVAAPSKTKTEIRPASAQAIKSGTFLEVKRLARIDLSGKAAEIGPLPADPKVEVVRKNRLKAPPSPTQQ